MASSSSATVSPPPLPSGCCYYPAAVPGASAQFIQLLGQVVCTAYGNAASALAAVPKREFHRRDSPHVVHDFGQDDRARPFGEDWTGAPMLPDLEKLRIAVQTKWNLATNHCTLLKFEDGQAHSVEPHMDETPCAYVVERPPISEIHTKAFCREAPNKRISRRGVLENRRVKMRYKVLLQFIPSRE